MAGISDAQFCLKLIPYGFDMVTLGGYNADKSTIKAGKQIIERGRNEFDVGEEILFELIENQANTLKKNWNGLVSINLRALNPEPIVEISKIKDIDVVEINAHCRQKEITEIGCGQDLLNDIDYLEDFVGYVVDNASAKVSVKIRANVGGVNEIEVAKALERAKCDYIHVDAMKPGFNCADFEVIKNISKATDIFLIGNNSIVDIESAKKMFESGACGVSIARAAISGKINFDLSKI
ncbi:MJ0144 family RNA dihydrouridine synthase-like protein [Methanobacterium alcaliphilum]|uniref:MJ0144 family RNA dihydrouridine synthase-like protein n=1 Tax=Methanobacterium alcaliphilum TaxID=392018 RepID=UPI00200A2341|nr:MJ0144 family RNA dihydrouridine synthase-like protein [Methanobacterium alcaliphilum]MCK9150378.1 tRNA-dihydrouridine synthase [Methanobacterium alcaliphilum]